MFQWYPSQPLFFPEKHSSSSPTFLSTISSNHPVSLFEAYVALIISLHQIDDVFDVVWKVENCCNFWYLKSISLFQIASFPLSIRHCHLARRLILNTFRFFTPSPPLTFCRHICPQLIQLIFWASIKPPHKNFLWIPTNLFMTFLVPWRKKKNNGGRLVHN